MKRRMKKKKMLKKTTNDEVLKDVYTGKPLTKERVKDYKGIWINTVDSILLLEYSKIVSSYDKELVKDIYTDKFVLTRDAHPMLIGLKDNGCFDIGYTVEIPSTATEVKINYFQELNEPISMGRAIFVQDAEKANLLDLEEVLGTGCYVSKKFDKSKLKMRGYRKFSFPPIKNTYKNLMKYGVISPTNIISEGKDYTFGLELETYGGSVPSLISKDLNLSCSYDGSILDNDGNKDTGGEYITGVLRGDNGFTHLYKICNELSKRCVINRSCSIHVHIGGIQFNKETVVLLYKTLKMLEKELFDMMPPSRNQREHCKKMKPISMTFSKGSYQSNIDRYYRSIIKIMSLGKYPNNVINKKHNHPRGRTCGWDKSTPRYWWANFIPTVFNIKGEDNYTIEIRNHSASLNFEKIKNWVLICFGIVSFVENNKRDIINNKTLSLRKVLVTQYPKKGEFLWEYVQERTKRFSGSKGSDNEILEYGRSENRNPSIKPSIKNVITL